MSLIGLEDFGRRVEGLGLLLLYKLFEEEVMLSITAEEI
jgi:hypothetical protein